MLSLVAALTVFATVDEAAISGLKHAAAICDPRYECGGVVRAVKGGYEASGLITSKRPFGVDLAEFYGPDVVADFHTHICSIHNQPFAAFFSSSDALANQGLHTIGHIVGWVSSDTTLAWRLAIASDEAQESRIRSGTRASIYRNGPWPPYRTRALKHKARPAQQ